MLNELEKLVDEEKWEEARSLIAKLELELKPSDRFAILNATVYMEEGKLEEAYKCITVGIICNPSNYELYYLLGNYYLNQNINQAYLCFEQALFYCDDEENKEVLEESMEFVRGLDGFEVHPVSFVMPSFNAADALKDCIDSIRKNHAESMYELVVVDNASSDGAVEWLKEQQDIKLQCNEKNEGFTRGCNQGIRLAASENDILLLHNDTIVPANALFWLRMGLYERKTVGAAGPISNNVANTFFNNQELNVSYDTAEAYLELAESIHLPMQQSNYENKIYLLGFALLIKRRALNEAGLLDERFEFGGEDADYGMTLSAAGFECLVCKNAFIIHHGGLSSAKERDEETAKAFERYIENGYAKLEEKWGFSPDYYMNINMELVDKLQEEQEACFSVLDVGCGCGTLLSYIKWKYPNARVYGIELQEKAAKLGKYMADITVGSVETMKLPYAEHTFDYVFFGDVLEHLQNPHKVLYDLKQYLKVGGKVVTSIPNLLNRSVIAPLLRGEFRYMNAGLLDKTHKHFFTKHEIERMFYEPGYKIIDMSATIYTEQFRMSDGDEELINALCKLPGVVPREEFEAYQYQVVAEYQE